MKYIILAVIACLFVWQIASGAPCWDWSNSCGNLPFCDPPPNAEYVLCSHYFCADDQVCGWDSTKKKFLGVHRRKYIWTDEGGNLRACVGPVLTGSPDWTERLCCLCSQPGILYEE